MGRIHLVKTQSTIPHEYLHIFKMQFYSLHLFLHLWNGVNACLHLSGGSRKVIRTKIVFRWTNVSFYCCNYYLDLTTIQKVSQINMWRQSDIQWCGLSRSFCFTFYSVIRAHTDAPGFLGWVGEGSRSWAVRSKGQGALMDGPDQSWQLTRRVRLVIHPWWIITR